MKLFTTLLLSLWVTTVFDNKTKACNDLTSVVFSAARDFTLRGPSAQVPFDVILVDTHAGFDATQSVYTVQQTGFYFISLSAAAPIYQSINYTLHGTSSNPNILLTHTEFDGELVTSRDDIQYLVEGQQLYVTSAYDLYSDGFMQTILSGFKISEALSSDNVFFRAARTTNYVPTTSYLPMDKLIINAGGAWDTCNGSQMIVRQSGIYFLSFSSASIPNTKHIVHLLVNSTVVARTYIYSNIFPGVDTSGQSVLLQLNVGDVVQLRSVAGNVSSDAGYQTSIEGFLYNPVHGEKIAWTVTFPGGQTTVIYGPTDIVRFSTVVLNEGSAWNNASGVVNIPTSGIYYLRLSGVADLEYRFNLVLSVNGQPLINVMEKVDTIRENCNLRSRSLVHHFKQGDQLVVSVPNGYNLLSWYYDAIFSGFLIQPQVTY